MKNFIILVSIFGLTCGLALEGDWREDQTLRENFADFIYNRLIIFRKSLLLNILWKFWTEILLKITVINHYYYIQILFPGMASANLVMTNFKCWILNKHICFDLFLNSSKLRKTKYFDQKETGFDKKITTSSQYSIVEIGQRQKW